MSTGDVIIYGLIGLIFVAPSVWALVATLRRKKAEAAAEEARKATRELEEKLAPLKRFLPIADVEAEVLRKRQEAEKQLDQMMEAAANEVGSIKDAANQEAKDIREKASASRAKAEETMARAIEESQRMVAAAREQAEEIAGSAYKAKENAELYERTAKAMKNVVQGYGDEYLIPNHSVLEDLAEEFGHKDAGQELQKVRKRIKDMIKNNLAANCDYAEANRRATAIEFVLDAFNGKVDTALSHVKHDNYGKLKQEILDAANLVNYNGQAFRNARIEPDYLNTRLDELKWCVALKELKLQEMEEQRRIKEEMREEERARREYEKAIREAEKEERMLQKAMAEARKQLEAASAEQKAQFEQQLLELQGKLEEAEVKNQRALSMAQQTRQGHVYIISNIGSFGEHVYKIGMTRRLEPMDRVKELGDASVPFSFDVHALIHSEDAPALENALHQEFDEHRVNKVNTRKEFFRAKIHDIRALIERLGMEVHWTMKAEAEEYRESLAMLSVTASQDEAEDLILAGNS